MQSTAIGRRAPKPVPYLDEARDLYNLLRDGHDALRFHISRGHALRHADTGRVELSSYVEPGRWLAARTVHPDGTQTDRPLNPYVLAQHLAGKYDVAWESPSWSSLLVLDIDAHVPDGLAGTAHWEAAREAARRRDATLARVWRAFGFGPDKQPVILKTPGGGYHLYLPLLRERADSGEALWPNASARRWVEHYLARAGLELAPGRLELFPSGVRLRAPCGRGMLLMEAERPDDPDNLRLEPVAGTCRGRLGVRGIEADFEDIEPSEDRDAGIRIIPLRGYSARRNVAAMCRAFLTAIEAGRRPLGQWLGADEPLWHPVWGPFGPSVIDDTKNRRGSEQCGSVLAPHKEEVQGGCGPCPPGLADEDSSDGWLLHGRAYLRRIVDLTENGLTEPGERHDAALKLTFYWGAVMALPREEVESQLDAWLRAFPHRSNLAATSETRFVRQTLREALHYYDHRVQHCAPGGRRRFDVALRPLAPADVAAFQAAVAPDAWRAVKAVLGYLRGHAEASGLVLQPVDLSQKALLLVCGDRRIQDEHGRRRRAYLVALEELERLGVLTLHQNYSKGRHGRRFSVWYRFGSGELPKPLQTGELVLAERQLTEGTLRVIGRGDGHHEARLDPHPDLQAASPPSSAAELATSAEPAAITGGSAPAPADLDQPDGRAWWRRMFAARVFTVAELAHADERTVIPGPWTWRRVSPPPAQPTKPPANVPPGPPRAANDQRPDASAAPAIAPGSVACPPDASSSAQSSPTPTSAPSSSPTRGITFLEDRHATRGPAPPPPAPLAQPAPELDPDLKRAIECAWKAFADRHQSPDS